MINITKLTFEHTLFNDPLIRTFRDEYDKLFIVIKARKKENISSYCICPLEENDLFRLLDKAITLIELIDRLNTTTTYYIDVDSTSNILLSFNEYNHLSIPNQYKIPHNRPYVDPIDYDLYIKLIRSKYAKEITSYRRGPREYPYIGQQVSI